jgi:hypothetical protein
METSFLCLPERNLTTIPTTQTRLIDTCLETQTHFFFRKINHYELQFLRDNLGERGGGEITRIFATFQPFLVLHLTSSLIWDFMQPRSAVVYRRFWTVFRFHLKMSSDLRKPINMGRAGYSEMSVKSNNKRCLNILASILLD